MKKKQVNLNKRKALLKEFLSKLISNKVTYINGKVIRASDLTYSLCQEVEKQIFNDVAIKISPYSHDSKNVKSSILLEIVPENNSFKRAYRHWIPIYPNKKCFNFISELDRIKIEKLISALKPIISKIDEEVAKINKEEYEVDLHERKKIIRRLKKDITGPVDFEKLKISELKSLENLIKKMK